MAVLWVFVLAVAASETALTYASQARLKEALRAGKGRESFFRYFERAPAAHPVCVIVRLFAIASLFFLAVSNAGRPGADLSSWVLAAAAVVAAELAGRYVGRRWATPTLLVFLPLLQLPGYLTGFLGREGRGGDAAPVSKDAADVQVVDAAIEEIRVAIKDAATEGAIHGDERDMIEGVLEFDDVEVHEIMTPRTEMECVDSGARCPLLNRLALFHHTRIPVFEDVRDKITGVLHVKDLIPVLSEDPGAGSLDVRDLMEKPYFVPETKRAVSLLRDFKKRHLQIAIILDEYGGVSGLVTMEDIMEQIVGELEEGFEAEKIEDRIRTLGGGALDIDAGLHVDEVNELLHVNLPEDEDYDTIGGFLLSRFAIVPEKGARMEYEGVILEVLEADERRVRRVLVKKNE